MALLLQPLQAGPLALKNRLVLPPMASAKAEADGKVSRALLEYYAEKTADGVLSLVIVEHSYIRADGRASARQLSVAGDDAVAGLSELVRTLHANGCKAVLQLNHAGSAADADVAPAEMLSASAIANPRKKGAGPREMTTGEIARMVCAFADAATRAKIAGFDGVEIHSAHGYLLNQFYSPLSNRRADAYGGSLLNRIRIHLETIEAVRAAVGSDAAVLLRLGAGDYMDGGSTAQDCSIAAREFERAGIDILDVSGGFCGYANPTYGGQGYFAELSEAAKRAASLPVILTGGISEAAAAERLLAEQKADLIGVGRAMLADSRWAKRAVESLA